MVVVTFTTMGVIISSFFCIDPKSGKNGESTDLRKVLILNSLFRIFHFSRMYGLKKRLSCCPNEKIFVTLPPETILYLL